MAGVDAGGGRGPAGRCATQSSGRRAVWLLPEHQHRPWQHARHRRRDAAAAKAGFNAIEPWVNEIDAYVTKGGTLKDLGKRIADAGLTVETPSRSTPGSTMTTRAAPRR
jgi:hypothetical protein